MTDTRELPCQRCGHVHEYVDEACVSCGCALTIERAAYDAGFQRGMEEANALYGGARGGGTKSMREKP